MFCEDIKNVIFKVLSSIAYCIMEKYLCVDYLGCPQTKLHVTNKVKVFENRTYNAVSGIGIPELLNNIISCRGFVKNSKSAVISSCCRKLVDYYPQKQLFFMKKIKCL